MLGGRIGRFKPLRVLLGAEVDALEQLGRQHDLRAGLRRLADEAFRLGDVLFHVVAVRRLDRSHGERSVLHD